MKKGLRSWTAVVKLHPDMNVLKLFPKTTHKETSTAIGIFSKLEDFWTWKACTCFLAEDLSFLFYYYIFRQECLVNVLTVHACLINDPGLDLT